MRSVVYFVRRVSCGSIKIGRTINLDRRLQELRSWWGPVELLHTIPGGLKEERAWHNAFQRDAIVNEWFRPSPALRQIIAEMRSRNK